MPSEPDRPPFWLHRPGEAVDVQVPAGWTFRGELLLPHAPWNLASRRWICSTTVDDHDRAVAAITAVARGIGLVVVVDLPPTARAGFLEDLHKVGAPLPTGGPWLPADHGALLAHLADGSTVTAASAALHISRRTANRLLAEVRAHYGVATTAEAVTAWLADRAPSDPSP